MNFDVIVVGAGPAGATAAKVLGEAGIVTLLLDKSAFPRDKPCGGGISARVMQRFPYLSGALAGIPVNWVSKIYFESPAGFAVDYESPNPLYLMIRRYEFDNLLFAMARPRVEFQAQALVRKVTIDSDGMTLSADVAGEPREFRSKALLGCDGANSVVARARGLRTGSARDEYAIDMMEETPYEELSLPVRDRMYVYYGFQGLFGYGYVFPKAKHINLGVGCKLDQYLAEFRGGHYSHHESFVEKRISDGLITGSSNRDNFQAFPLPISGPLRQTYSDRVLLCGDAGGFVNAFTAEGIFYAMVTGELAAKAAIEAVRAQDFSQAGLSRYERAWKKEIGMDLEKSVKIQRLLREDISRVDRLVKEAMRNWPLADLLARYATGALDYSHFKRSVVRRALPLYIQERVLALFDRR